MHASHAFVTLSTQVSEPGLLDVIGCGDIGNVILDKCGVICLAAVGPKNQIRGNGPKLSRLLYIAVTYIYIAVTSLSSRYNFIYA